MPAINQSPQTFIQPSGVTGLFEVTRPTNTDDRGFFREVFHLDEIISVTGVNFKPVQWNHSLSKPGVIRALHAEHWHKLIYPVTGTLFAAIVDIRPDSPTFAKVVTFNLNADEHKALFISEGLANSICVVGDTPVNYLYLVDAYYTGQDTTAIAWNDPDLNISWPVEHPILSIRDQHNPRLRDLFPEKFIH